MSYFEKYLKYKSKYLRLKQLLNNETQAGGGKRDILQIDALSDTPTNLEAFGYDIGDFPNLPNYSGGANNKDEMKEDEMKEETKKEIVVDSESDVSNSESDESDSDSVKTSDSENSDESDSEIETDSELTTTASDEDQEGGGFFGNLMDELSSSVKSFDLQKGGYDDDSELSPLSEDDVMELN